MMLCGLESLRGRFNRSLRVEGKADRTLVLYGQSITYFSQWLAQRGDRLICPAWTATPFSNGSTTPPHRCAHGPHVVLIPRGGR